MNIQENNQLLPSSDKVNRVGKRYSNSVILMLFCVVCIIAGTVGYTAGRNGSTDILSFDESGKYNMADLIDEDEDMDLASTFHVDITDLEDADDVGDVDDEDDVDDVDDKDDKEDADDVGDVDDEDDEDDMEDLIEDDEDEDDEDEDLEDSDEDLEDDEEVEDVEDDEE
jgi:hypothetical protein